MATINTQGKRDGDDQYPGKKGWHDPDQSPREKKKKNGRQAKEDADEKEQSRVEPLRVQGRM